MSSLPTYFRDFLSEVRTNQEPAARYADRPLHPPPPIERGR